MEPTADDLAGVVDLFGALTRAELGEALAELLFKQGEEADEDTFDAAIDAALDSYHLIAVGTPADEDGETDGADPVLVPGPVAFPTLPEGGTDLPHIMDVPERAVDQETVAEAAEERFRADAAAAVGDGDRERIRALLDASYELEAWGPVDLSGARDRLDSAVESDGTN